jgi:hypothetical protein
MGIGPVTRRTTSLDALWARWLDATRSVQPEAAQPAPAGTKTLAPPVGLASRRKRLAMSPMSMLQMAPRQPAPKAAAFNGPEAMTKALNPRGKARVK